MDKKMIQDEIDVCNSLIEKFKEAMLDCKTDYEALKKLEPTEGDTKIFKDAFKGVKNRHDDISVSVKLVKNRLSKLEEDLKNAE